MLSDRRVPPARRSLANRRAGPRRRMSVRVRVERRGGTERRVADRRRVRERRSAVPRRSADRRRVTPGSFSADQAERLRRVVMSGKSRFACPNCEQTLDIDPPTSVRGTNVWEVHCAGCFRSAMITDTKRTSVMIVDDESLIRETLATVVMRAGHDVTDFADGASALIAYRDSPADVVLLDMLMPKMPGIDFMRALQREFPEAKVIAMSGQRRHGAPDPLATAKKLGAVRILRKPFTPPELLRALDEVVGAGRRSAGY